MKTYKQTNLTEITWQEIDGDSVTTSTFLIDSDEHKQLLAEGVKIKMLSKAAKVDIEKQRTRDETNQNALSYLASTDWFVARLTETGKPIPADVIEQRAKAREAVERV